MRLLLSTITTVFLLASCDLMMYSDRMTIHQTEGYNEDSEFSQYRIAGMSDDGTKIALVGASWLGENISCGHFVYDIQARRFAGVKGSALANLIPSSNPSDTRSVINPEKGKILEAALDEFAAAEASVLSERGINLTLKPEPLPWYMEGENIYYLLNNNTRTLSFHSILNYPDQESPWELHDGATIIKPWNTNNAKVLDCQLLNIYRFSNMVFFFAKIKYEMLYPVYYTSSFAWTVVE